MTACKQADIHTRVTLGDICAQVDELMANLKYCDPKMAAKVAFSENLDAATVAAIKRLFPTLDGPCTSDKKFLNVVFLEAYGAEMWRWSYKKENVER